MIIALFALAAAAGAVVRFLATENLNRSFPTGTLVVNVGASFALGLLSQAGPDWQTVAGIGALGALSTWSSVAVEVASLARDRQGALAALYLAATTTTGVVAAWLGIQLAVG